MNESSKNMRKKIGRSVYLVENKKKKILKYEPQVSASKLHRLSRFLFHGSLPFRNEVYVNELLNDTKFEYFKYPKAIILKNPKRIEFQYIEGIEKRITEKTEKIAVIKSLIEYSSLWKRYKFSGLAGFTLKYIESPLLKLLRSILSSNYSLAIKSKATLLLIAFFFKKNNNSPVLLHNDIQCKNIMREKNGDIYLIDFEDTTIEKHLIISDAFNIAFDRKHLTVDKSLLTLFKEYFDLKNKNTLTNDSLSSQVRICLLRLAFSPCSLTIDDKEYNLETDAIFSIAIDDEKFIQWWEIQC